MSAFGGKADMTLCGCLLSRSLLGVKRTWLIAAHMSAFDPKRTSRFPSKSGLREMKVALCESDLAMHDDIVARAKCNRALMCDRIECRYAKFAEIVDAESTDINVVGSPI